MNQLILSATTLLLAIIQGFMVMNVQKLSERIRRLSARVGRLEIETVKRDPSFARE